jgi:hypothetical protein
VFCVCVSTLSLSSWLIVFSFRLNGLRCSHLVYWFGRCGNRKLKGRKPEAVVKCPVCKASEHDSEMSIEAYWGS